MSKCNDAENNAIINDVVGEVIEPAACLVTRDTVVVTDNAREVAYAAVNAFNNGEDLVLHSGSAMEMIGVGQKVLCMDKVDEIKDGEMEYPPLVAMNTVIKRNNNKGELKVVYHRLKQE